MLVSLVLESSKFKALDAIYHLAREATPVGVSGSDTGGNIVASFLAVGLSSYHRSTYRVRGRMNSETIAKPNLIPEHTYART